MTPSQLADYAQGASDALRLPAELVLAAAQAAHPGRALIRQHICSTANAIAAGRRRFARNTIQAELIAAQGEEDE